MMLKRIFKEPRLLHKNSTSRELEVWKGFPMDEVDHFSGSFL